MEGRATKATLKTNLDLVAFWSTYNKIVDNALWMEVERYTDRQSKAVLLAVRGPDNERAFGLSLQDF